MPEPPPMPASSTEADVVEIGERLQALKNALGAEFWQSDDVKVLQQDLRRRIGSYAAWGEDKLPMHQRARRAARLESEYAHLLWPGRADP